MKEMWTSLASVMGVLAFCQGLLNAVFPPELRQATARLLHRLTRCFSTHCYFDIMEIDGVNTNELYNAVQLYLSSSPSVSGSRLSLTRNLNSSAVTFGLANNDRIVDCFRGAVAVWEHVVAPRQPGNFSFSWRPHPDEKRGFTLRVRKKDKQLILGAYLDHIMNAAGEIRRRNRDRLLYTNSRGGSIDSRGHPWESVPFKHPSTFETLAMEVEKKAEIMADLREFAGGKAFYQRTGRAWKRGYLLYGPPGTGKSSMIAAMANYLRYDIYDLELSEVQTNSELRKLLMKTTSKSIIVIEDIDCSVNLTNRNAGKKTRGVFPPPPPGTGNPCEDGMEGIKSVTLSGLLNFTDGLWSCCGSERIFVFTTNHVEKLDPALLRSGRMDMHIFMSYCSFPALKTLVKNYLGVEVEELVWGSTLLGELEAAVEEAKMTPADISEVLIKNRRHSGRKAVGELLEAMKRKDGGGGGLAGMRNSCSRVLEEEEEQEKRTLETPKDGAAPAEAAVNCSGNGDRNCNCSED